MSKKRSIAAASTPEVAEARRVAMRRKKRRSFINRQTKSGVSLTRAWEAWQDNREARSEFYDR